MDGGHVAHRTVPPEGHARDVFLPTVCPACGALGPAPCGGCRAALAPPPALPAPPGVTSCAALAAYVGVAREVVARLKYRPNRAALPWLAGRMAALAAGTPADAVTWVPTATDRRRRRGFDHGQLLARAVAARLDLPCRPLLRRRPGPAQTGRSRAERLGGPPLQVRPGARIPARVLVVDDVVTTGATLTVAAGCLRAGGAHEVHAVVAARRP